MNVFPEAPVDSAATSALGMMLVPGCVSMRNVSHLPPARVISELAKAAPPFVAFVPCTRIVAPQGRIRIATTGVVEDSGAPDEVVPAAVQHPVQDLPEESLVFLLGSRYCETDHLSQAAWDLFGQTEPGWTRVQAICDFVHRHISFGYEHASPSKTAEQVFKEGRGVCRDYAHLAIAFCRCMNIPARYCAGYLGDIGIPPPYGPMDFAGWFEAYLGGRWHTFDARNNIPRIGRILIARGRDAADAAICSTFGPSTLVSFKVYTDEVTAPA